MIKGHTPAGSVPFLFCCSHTGAKYCFTDMLKKYKKSPDTDDPFYFALILKKFNDPRPSLLIKPKVVVILVNG
jgi:hypothetical protein